MIHYDHCPNCKSAGVKEVLTASDHTVSHETFSIWECSNCTLRFTQDVPAMEEIGKYYQSAEYISHSDTRKGLINQLYHRVRLITLKGKCALIKRETGLPTGRLLDIGCGTGAFLNTMQTSGWAVTGLEPDAETRSRALALYGIDPLLPEQLFTLPENHFNAITMWHVLEHVHQLHEYISRVKKLLTEKGLLIVAVPNYTSHDAGVYQASWAAYDVPRHLYHFSPKSMQLLMDQHGLMVKKIKPMWFDSFYVSMLSEQYKNKKGNIMKAFTEGAVSNFSVVFNKKRCSSLVYIISKK